MMRNTPPPLASNDLFGASTMVKGDPISLTGGRGDIGSMNVRENF